MGHIESLSCFLKHNDSIFSFVVLNQFFYEKRDACECGTNWDTLSVELKWLKVARVLGILTCIGSGLESHKRPNCQGLLAEASTLSTAWEIIACKEEVVILMRGRTAPGGPLPLEGKAFFFSWCFNQQASIKCPGLKQKEQRGRLSTLRPFLCPQPPP